MVVVQTTCSADRERARDLAVNARSRKAGWLPVGSRLPVAGLCLVTIVLGGLKIKLL